MINDEAKVVYDSFHAHDLGHSNLGDIAKMSQALIINYLPLNLKKHSFVTCSLNQLLFFMFTMT